MHINALELYKQTLGIRMAAVGEDVIRIITWQRCMTSGDTAGGVHHSSVEGSVQLANNASVGRDTDGDDDDGTDEDEDSHGRDTGRSRMLSSFAFAAPIPLPVEALVVVVVVVVVVVALIYISLPNNLELLKNLNLKESNLSNSSPLYSHQLESGLLHQQYFYIQQ